MTYHNEQNQLEVLDNIVQGLNELNINLDSKLLALEKLEKVAELLPVKLEKVAELLPVLDRMATALETITSKITSVKNMTLEFSEG